MFGGTFAAKGGIRPASRFEFELEDPVLKRTIRHGYDVIDAAGAGLAVTLRRNDVRDELAETRWLRRSLAKFSP